MPPGIYIASWRYACNRGVQRTRPPFSILEVLLAIKLRLCCKHRLLGHNLQVVKERMEASHQARHLQGDLLDCQYSDDTIAAGGFSVLADVNPAVATTRVASLPSGLLVSLRTEDGQKSSSHEANLGRLTCQRCAALLAGSDLAVICQIQCGIHVCSAFQICLLHCLPHVCQHR